MKRLPAPLDSLRGKSLSAFSIALALIAYILPSPLWLIAFFPLLIGFHAKTWREQRNTCFLLVAIFLLVNRTLGLAIVLYDSEASFPVIGMPDSFLRRYFPVSLGGLADISIAEHAARRRYMAVVRAKALKVDPFSGHEIRQSGQTLYSVGPDLVDDGMATEYDPTNGTLSSGDVEVGAWLNGESVQRVRN